MDHDKILYFIKLIRDSVPNAIEVYTQGNCGSFGLILLFAFPNGKILYYLRDHVVFQLGFSLYDITGDITGKYPYDKLTPIENEGDINDINNLLTPRYKAS